MKKVKQRKLAIYVYSSSDQYDALVIKEAIEKDKLEDQEEERKIGVGIWEHFD